MTSKLGIDLSAIDHNTRPQDDFYRHATGIWQDTTDIPEDQPLYGTFQMLRNLSEEQVKAILEDAAANPKPGVSQKLGDMYGSFMDEAKADQLGVSPIKGDLDRIAAVSSLNELTRLIGEFSKQGITELFGMGIESDPGNPERHIMFVGQSGLSLPNEAYYREEKHAEVCEAFIPFAAKMFEHAGWAPADAQAAAKRILDFETRIAAHHWDVVAQREMDKIYNLRTFAQLVEMTPTFDWNSWLAGSGIEERIFAESVVMMPSFMEAVSSFYNDQNLEDAKLWFSFQLINSMAPYLSSDFVNTRFDFYGRKLTGAPEMRARWKRAVQAVEGSLGEAIGEIYVEKHFPIEAKQKMDRLVSYLVEAYRESITNLTWMSETTKKRALEKLDKFTPKIGYPVKWRDYSALEIDRDDLVGNIRRVAAFEMAHELDKIGKPIDKDEWGMTPQTVNAYYHPLRNEIVFPAAILQPPFFNFEADDAVNFGAIGSVIGHEIGHGFDDQGSKFDGDGALKSWWTEEDRAEFEKLTGSLIDQYNQLSPAQLDDSHKVNGAFTIGENIGDLGGVAIALKAYYMSLEGKEPEVIDGLSAEKRFFLAYATNWRQKGRDEIMIQRLA
ncbi:MAG: hypothetical protein RL719_1020, partial [Actinomycetota bacterium]